MGITVEQLEAEFAAFNLMPGGGVVVLPAAEAINLIERAAWEGYAVLGLDGFHVRGAEGHAVLADRTLMRGVEIQPDLEHSIDYSLSTAPSPGAWSEAVAFVREHAACVTGFEVVLGDRVDGVAPA
jgi:hypothetical protein